MKFCKHCGKELLDESVICPACGCCTQEQKTIHQDYQLLLRKTKLFMIIGLALLALGLFAWIGTFELTTLYYMIAEAIQRPRYGTSWTYDVARTLYHTCEQFACWSSLVFFLAAEIMFIIPREKFNYAFRKENNMLLTHNKAEYKQTAKKKNQELNKAVSCYRLSWMLAIIACVLFVVSVFIPSLGLII